MAKLACFVATVLSVLPITLFASGGVRAGLGLLVLVVLVLFFLLTPLVVSIFFTGKVNKLRNYFSAIVIIYTTGFAQLVIVLLVKNDFLTNLYSSEFIPWAFAMLFWLIPIACCVIWLIWKKINGKA
ncbi:hypothetical protein H0A36_16030 [Endozoicomonas sp. SM1973]|uniref:Uncharacterized protein n=1 Tax=Spartinivicinus marinus TaxID=2994442 RepID=A0A853IDD7_9GAMM|nr:hypothetical protein [Spartinivicinus marinus]MCX4029803.1 hypothetical protein [Spartinivicinus marinus]NYZ67527.1 hypothetical protein [Spartinivicinus marinus]